MTGAHRDAGARSDAEHADDAERADRARACCGSELGFDGLDLHRLDGDGRRHGDATRRAKRPSAPIKAGNDIVLHSPDDGGGVRGDARRRSKSGEIPEAQVDASVERILRAKARAGPAPNRSSSTSTRVADDRRHARATRRSPTRSASESITLVKDERNQVPLKLAARRAGAVPVGARLPGGWRIAAPSRTFIPELRKRWPNVTAIELSDRTTAVGDRARARDGAALRRDRRVGVRARRVGQRPHGSRAAAAAAAAARSRGRRPAPAAVRDDVLRQSRTWRRSCRSCRRCC